MSDQTHMPSIDDAARLAADLLDGDVRQVEPHQSRFGDASWRYRVEARAGQMLLKINRRSGVPVGAYYHGRLSEAGVPVPRMIDWRSDGWAEDHACALYEWVDGVPVDFALEQEPPYDEAQMGEILRAIHGITHEDGFGRLNDTGRGECESWQEGLLSTWSLGACVKREAISGEMAERLAELADRFSAELLAARTSLLHYEDIMFSGNCIVDDQGGIIAVIDFGGALAGDPMWELMVFDYYFGAHYPPGAISPGFDLDRFHEGYGLDYDPRAPLQRLYAVGMALEKLAFIDLDSQRAALNRSLLDEVVTELAA